ncbi:hypothetical protein OAB62_05520 [Pseudomonadales bacterium]|nr:hypothetical protein [Pseudomonadales bacterium]
MRFQMASLDASILNEWIQKRLNDEIFSDKFEVAVAIETLRFDNTVRDVAAKRLLHSA